MFSDLRATHLAATLVLVLSLVGCSSTPGGANSSRTAEIGEANAPSSKPKPISTAAPNVTSGQLTGTRTSATTPVNLTEEGAVDWAHWGSTTFTSKRTVKHLIGHWLVVGAGVPGYYTDDPRAVTFTDGDSPASATVRDGIYINGQSNGFLFDVPADTDTRTLTVHVGAFNSGATFRAHLSDHSAEDFVDTQKVCRGQSDQNYTLTYHAASPGEHLTVTWVREGGTGNVTLGGAALR